MTVVEAFGSLCAAAVLTAIAWVLRPRSARKLPGESLSPHLARAESWLLGNGYQIIRRRQKAEWIGYYGKDEFRKLLLVDFIVRKGAASYAVKVTQAPDYEISGLRLREEWFPLCRAFGVQGLLHLDVADGTSRAIDFEVRSPWYVRARRCGQALAWLGSGALAMFAWLHRA